MQGYLVPSGLRPRCGEALHRLALAAARDPDARDAQRNSPVAKAEPSPAARRKAASKHTDPAHGEALPVHSFRTLLADLATLTRNTVRLGRDRIDIVLAAPTKVQRRALDLLGVSLAAVDSQTMPNPSYINSLHSTSGKVRFSASVLRRFTCRHRVQRWCDARGHDDRPKCRILLEREFRPAGEFERGHEGAADGRAGEQRAVCGGWRQARQ